MNNGLQELKLLRFFSMSSFLEGFLLQASLILALGAQNLFVLESGLRRQKHALAATVCTICDFALIFVGVLGAASVFVRYPLLKISFGGAGVAFLFYYGILKLKDFRSPSLAIGPNQPGPDRARSVFAAAMAFSLLNPHVYLDTVILIGGYAAKFPAWQERLVFGTGAGVFSTLWFYGLAFAASSLSALLRKPKRMRFVSLASGLILIGLALKLGHDVWGWISL
ncbi:MAG: LysE/ArgO family amino acid transporter [Bdellovibrionales bacterium]